MQLREDIRQTLADEFSFASDQMDKAGDLQEMLYYYSAFYGAAFRALNLEWDRELALVHLVLQSSHRDLTQLTAGLSGGQRLFAIPPEITKELTKSCTELAYLFGSGQTDMATMSPLLARIAEISYASTGNGRYNYVRGNLKL